MFMKTIYPVLLEKQYIKFVGRKEEEQKSSLFHNYETRIIQYFIIKIALKAQ